MPLKPVTFKPRTCPICNTEFIPVNHRQIYDHIGCRQKHWRNEQISIPREELFQTLRILIHRYDQENYADELNDTCSKDLLSLIESAHNETFPDIS